MTYNVFGGTLSLTQSINHIAKAMKRDMYKFSMDAQRRTFGYRPTTIFAKKTWLMIDRLGLRLGISLMAARGKGRTNAPRQIPPYRYAPDNVPLVHVVP